MSTSTWQTEYLSSLSSSPSPVAYLAPAPPALATAAGVDIAQTRGLTSVAEGGAGDAYTLVLATCPTKNVTISLAAGAQLRVSPKKLTFTKKNWNAPQTVTVTAVNDTVAEGPHTGSILHKVSSRDKKYKSVKVPSVDVSIADDDLSDLHSDHFLVPREALEEIHSAPPPADSIQAASAVPLGADWYDTSEYMLGDVWVTVVLLESNGRIDASTENWKTSEISEVKSEINEGLKWWEDTLAVRHPSSKTPLKFHVDFTYANSPVPTDYEPIKRSASDQDQSLWIDSFLNRVGYNTPSTRFTDLRRWNHDQRVAHDANWSFTIFVVDSSADPDGKFSDGRFAYAYLGGPYAVMTYDNNGWGIGRMGHVLAHETGHIFYALDEYPGSDDYTDRSGFYNTQNLNAFDGHPNPSSRVTSLMAEANLQIQAYAAHTSSPTSLQMIGWKDSDADGIFDVLDVPLTLTGTGSYDASTRQFNFSGTSSVGVLPNQNPNSSKHAISLNRIDLIQYRLDSGSWTDGNRYPGTSVTVSQSVPVSPGRHTIEFRTVSLASGVTSAVWSQTFDTGTPVDLVLDGTPGNDTIELRDRAGDPNTYEVWMNARLVRSGPWSTVSKITINGQAGDDVIRALTSSYVRFGISLTLHGGDGNDRIEGHAGNDILYGDAGNDVLYGGSGDDTFDGGSGHDAMYGGPGIDSMLGGSGNDLMYGGDDRDIMNGTIGDDEMYGDAGNDWLFGAEGNDSIHGGPGNDDLTGYIGDDELFGDAGDDALYGGDGDDTINGGEGNDYMKGELGMDSMLGGPGNDLMYGGDDRDIMNGTIGDDEMYGDAGNDWLFGAEGNDSIHGGPGNDAVIGYIGNDRLYGDEGDDYLDGGEGDDYLDGGPGNDTLVDGSGNNILL